MLYDYRPVATTTLQQISAYPKLVIGGDNGTYTSPKGVVLLDGRAPRGAKVTLRSSNPTVLSAPASVTVAKGSSDAPFTIVTREVATTQVVEITATYGGITKRFSVTVYPAQ